MKYKSIVIILGCIFIFLLTACSKSEVIEINVSDNENIYSNHFGIFIEVGNNLVYDSATRIVYIDNFTYSGHSVYTPYYSSNGLPFRYNPETNTFEEIDK